MNAPNERISPVSKHAHQRVPLSTLGSSHDKEPQVLQVQFCCKKKKPVEEPNITEEMKLSSTLLEKEGDTREPNVRKAKLTSSSSLD